MKRPKFFPDHFSPQVPKLAWLEVAEIMLKIAYDLFSLSKRFGRVRVLDGAGLWILQFVERALGHAPAEPHIELGADIPVQI